MSEETESKLGEVDESQTDEILDYLDSMIKTYPDEQYTKMKPYFLEWESVTRQLTYNGMVSELGNFTSKFWNTFSRVELRIHHNENIPRLKIHRWKRERDEHIVGFQKEIQNYRTVLLNNREPTNVLDEVSEEFDEAIEETYQDIMNG